MNNLIYANAFSIATSEVEGAIILRVTNPDFDEKGQIKGTKIETVADVRLPISTLHLLKKALNDTLKDEQNEK
ncbi:MAG: hypothetical protein E7300_00820 [Lachnospiraceae bacterium]|nr:hypothetical protein [Lachnospiraceae bacterium]